MSEILGTGLAFPIRLGSDGRVVMASDVVDIEQAIRLILGTAQGERPMRPEFGCRVHDMVFERIDAATAAEVEDAVREALDQWEPRIVVQQVDFEVDEPAGVLRIDIVFRVRATNAKRNLVYPFYVVPEEEDEA
jgi:phage baseplate assembly protein W